VRGGAFGWPGIEHGHRHAALVQGKCGAEPDDPAPNDDN
jgi:hypothetical protein